MAEKIATQIQDGNNFKQVSYRLNLQSSVGNKDYEEFESRKLTLTNVMEALRDPSVSMVGVWGMGGVGKTMLAKEVARRAKDEEKLFTMVVFTAISKDPNIKKIQQDIGEYLGMSLPEENKDVRRDRLQNRLKQENKILIIVDDIWEKLDLVDVGISFENNQKGCKILLTTRSYHVLANDMGVDGNVIFTVGDLLEHEAMSLFHKIMGDFIAEKDDDFQRLATQIVKECRGLPIAITTVASALKNKGFAVWKNALQELRKSNPINIQGMHEKVYTSIKFSYDYLRSVEAKQLLLLCSLFPEDANIDLRVLCNYGFGLNLFEDVNTLEEARNKTDALITSLKDHSLLLGGDVDKYGHDRVKLHDVIRDVVIFIASRLDDHHRMHNIRNADELEKYFNKEMSKDSTAISLYGIKADQYPQTLKSPELNLLRLVRGYGENSGKLLHQFFEGLKKLLVLHLKDVSLEPLPATSSFCLLPNLQTLCLTGCILEDISWIGELKNLKILDISHNFSIVKLPREIGKLNRLLSLSVHNCNLKVIEPNVISSLTRLEELNLENSFKNWEVEGVANGDERRNANLSEVKNLPHLIDLNLDVPDINSVPKDMFSEQLEKYYIRIGADQDNFGENTSRTLKLKLTPNSVLNEHDFKALMGRSTALYLNGLKCVKSIAFEMESMGFKHLKHLTVEESTEIRCIVKSNNGNIDYRRDAFPSLKSLVLRRLMNLENIIHETLIRETSFGKLREIVVGTCHKMKSLFPLQNIPKQLERITVKDCKMMEEIISHHGREGDHVEKIEIFALQSLRLTELPKLVQFEATRRSDGLLVQFEATRRSDESIGDDSVVPLFNGQVVFPKLEELDIRSLNIRKIWNDDQPPASRFDFQSLTKLEVRHCHHLKGLIPLFMTYDASLVHLGRLCVWNCKIMKEIIFIEESALLMSNSISLAQLESLELYNLPNLERFCEVDFSFSKLESLNLRDLPKLERFCKGDFSFPQLESLHLFTLSNFDKFCEGDISFPKLKSLKLEFLPNLERFCGVDYVDCPSLSRLEIRSCLKLRIFITNTMSTTTTENQDENSKVDKQHLSHHKDVVKVDHHLNTESCCSENTCQSYPVGSVEEHDDDMVFKTKRLSALKLWNFPYLQQPPKTFPTVKELSMCDWDIRLKDLETPLMCFQNLKFLFVKGCHGLTSLFSPSTAKSLSQQLTKLSIVGCKSLTQVIGNDHIEAHEDNINIIFSQLTYLLLYDLSNLTSFYSGNNNNNVVLQFPQLSRLTVGDCPEMKTFYHGNIHCPSLGKIYVCESMQDEVMNMLWYHEIHGLGIDYSYWKGDINTTIRKLWEEKNTRDSSESEENVENTEEDHVVGP